MWKWLHDNVYWSKLIFLLKVFFSVWIYSPTILSYSKSLLIKKFLIAALEKTWKLQVLPEIDGGYSAEAGDMSAWFNQQ